MQYLVFLTAMTLVSGVSGGFQGTPSPAATASTPAKPQGTPATGRDYFLFTRALRPLQQGQVTTQVTMDVAGEGLHVTVRGDIVLTHKSSGEFVSEMTVQPPMGGKPRRYKVINNDTRTWVQDLSAKTYAIQKVGEDNEFLVRGLLVGLAKTALAKLKPEQLKLMDAPEPTPELLAALEAGTKDDEGTLKVRDETREGKTYRVYDLQPEKNKEGVISLFVGTASYPERLTMTLTQDKLKINFTEAIKSVLPAIPAGTSFRYTPTRGIKKVKKIDLGSF